jgi:cytochrome c-type biogenesis protein CcmF
LIPELGHLALWFALPLAALQAVVGIVGAQRGSVAWMSLTGVIAKSQAWAVLIATLCLAYAFLTTDFSVLYVASNANSQLPWPYRLSAVWGAHEGSLLLWALVLSGWTVAVVRFRSGLPDAFLSRVVGVLGGISVGFMLFILTTSNPFLRLLPAAAEGRDLNPLLQDPGLAIHPPMLYIGYVGFAVAFAIAVAALIEGRVDSAWTRWARPWTLAAWAALTLGIALGSWWAYYELGWGGWWFWDPVENASFMPWLAGTALIHSLAVTEQRDAFRAWTILLAIATFSLSLLGTFLVRSGVLISVHAFASDPARGLFILIFLAVAVGGALTLYAMRASTLAGGSGFALMSRETLLLINNLLLGVVCVAILWGTLYPLFADAVGAGKISVGPPWFSLVFVSITAPLLLIVGLGPMTHWKRDEAGRLLSGRWLQALVAVIATLIITWIYDGGIGTFIGVALGTWVLATAGIPVWRYLSMRRMPPRQLVGMTIAHIGVGVFALGVTVTSQHSQHRDVALGIGDHFSVSGYTFLLEGTQIVQGPNYQAQEASIAVFGCSDPDQDSDCPPIAQLAPQKRVYLVQQNPMTEAAIDAGFTRDLFVAMGEPVGQGRWSFRIQVKPLIRFIWGGALLMALGGLLAASDRRYRRGEAAA